MKKEKNENKRRRGKIYLLFTWHHCSEDLFSALINLDSFMKLMPAVSRLEVFKPVM